MNEDVMRHLVPAIWGIGICTYLVVKAWVRARQREREAYYKSETLKKIAETSGAGTSAAQDLFREQENNTARERRERYTLKGLIAVALGIAFTVFLRAKKPDDSEYLIGLVPLLYGAAYLIYVYILGPKEQ